MANRMFQEKLLSLIPNLTAVQVEVSIGATGAPTVASKAGVASVARTGTGAYTITLDDAYSKFKGLDWAFDEQAAGSSGIFMLAVVDADGASNGVKNKTLKIICRNASGTATDPTNGVKLFLTAYVRNSSLKQAGES